ncbi:MAG TPA: ABC transporter permease [Gaiellaceae bacterium]|jgi:teichoic acid transport system permease protein|nr:ABC transporter permease [Gaiellaceae bacterium]
MATRNPSRAGAPQLEGPADAPPSPAPERRRHGREDEFTSVRHVYEPHTIGLPPLGSYLRELWRRREFAIELARTDLRAQHFNTVFGQLWLVLNGILLGLIYFLLVVIISRGNKDAAFFGHLLAALFIFRFVSRSVKQGARSVVGGGRLILNTAFPRALLPLSSVLGAFLAFLPLALVYAVVHVVLDKPVGPELVWLLPVTATFVVFACGAAMFIATAQVYFRDLKSFLPYLTRVWLYSSPILYFVDQIPERLKPILMLNPLYPMLGALSSIVDEGEAPSAQFLLWGFGWAVLALVVGGLFFISREREFAVRI